MRAPVTGHVRRVATAEPREPQRWALTIDQNKAAVRSYFERFADMAVADAIFGTEVRFHYPLGGLNGLDAVKGYTAAVRKAFPDIRFNIEDMLGEGELVAARWTLVGRHTGELRGRPPTGKLVNVPGNTIFRLKEGKIAEMWVTFDPSRLF